MSSTNISSWENKDADNTVLSPQRTTCLMKIVYSSKGKLFIQTWTKTLKISIICIASPHDLKLTLSLVEPLKTKTKSLAKLLGKKKKKGQV